MSNNIGKFQITIKQKKIALLVIVAAIVVITLLVIFRNNEIAKTEDQIKNSVVVNASELILNKERYENMYIKVENVLVPDPNFAYIEKGDGAKEKLFIDPKKSEFCLHFNLIGKLQRDEKREWLFYVESFECVSKN